MSISWNRREFLAGTISTAIAAKTLTSWGQERGTAEDAVYEFRQYTLHKGQRDTLITLFEKDYIESQNKLGAHVIGTFRDVDDPDRFVWIRGFRDMPSRQAALTAFYGGPVWQATKAAANATMLDSDNVLLLQPAAQGQGFRPQPPSQSQAGADGVIGVTIYYLANADAQQFAQFFQQSVMPISIAAGAQPVARLVTEDAPNNFPRLPIREHDRTFLWFVRWPDLAAENAFFAKFSALSGWRDSAPESVFPALMRKPERLRLLPTSRSVLR